MSFLRSVPEDQQHVMFGPERQTGYKHILNSDN